MSVAPRFEDGMPRLVEQLLREMGEDPTREGLVGTPERVSRSLRFLTEGYGMDAHDAVGDALFAQDYDEIVVVRDIPFYSLCLPSKQLVNAVGGARPASAVTAGDRLYTLVNGEVKQTTVRSVARRHARELVRVTTSQGTLVSTPDHPFATPDGWVEAGDLSGRLIEFTEPRQLCRRRAEPRLGYDFGYVIGATAADGTVGRRGVSLVVNQRSFAERFAGSAKGALGLDEPVEHVTRPSGFLGRDVEGYRVRVSSSYLADLLRQYLGGDGHHLRQLFPRVVLNDRQTFQGFLDGYRDGDGFSTTRSGGGTNLCSSNEQFLRELAAVVGARFTPARNGRSRLYIANSWERRHGFRAESHRTTLRESRWVDVVSIDRVHAGWRKPFTVYAFQCDPYPTFLVNGHLSHNCEHHLLPFFGVAHVGYAPRGRVVGLSKIPRLVDVYAHRLQLQERLTRQIAEGLEEVTQPGGVAVVVEARHLCMEMRGVEKSGQTATSCMLGCFRDDPRTRAEFLQLIRRT